MEINLKGLNNALIICPKDYKEIILDFYSSQKQIADINFISLEEYKKNYYFDYDINTINELVKDGLTPNNAKEIIENLYYIEDKNYNNSKLDKLVEYKKKLDNKGLLIYNRIFKQYVLNKNVYVLGYGKLTKDIRKIITGKTINIIENEYKIKKFIINRFSNISEEVEFVYNRIYDLLEQGIDINKIFVMNAGSEYSSYIKRFNNYYNFNIETKDNSYIIGTKLGQNFIEMLDENSKEEIYDYLKKINNEISNKLISLLNKYAEYDLESVKELIISDLKGIKIKTNYNNIIKNIDIFNATKKDDYIFFLGFNDNVPTLKKDIDYITDNIKHLVDLETTEQQNEIIKNNFINYLSNIDNLILSYSENTAFNQHNKQFIIDSLSCEYIENETSYDYSEKLNKAKYSHKLDTLRKFNSIEENLSELKNVYGRGDYLTYNNKFKGLSDKQNETLIRQININKEKQNDVLSLSYSTINNFFECNFKYYLDTVLKIKEPFGNYYTKLGTVCHGVLKDFYNDEEFEFDKSWNNQIEIEKRKENKEIFEDESEKYFVNKIKDELQEDIRIISQQKQNSLLNKTKCEEYFEYKVSDKIKFIGFIDKIMFKETNDEILASVVDYKTSKSIEIDKEIMKYGLSLQLPSYLYLIKHSKGFNKEVKFAGLYIQHLLNYNRNYIDEASSLFSNKKESLKLDGISSSNTDRMEALDITLQSNNKSESIKGISINKDGSLKKSSKLYTDEQFNELYEIVENSIKNAGEAIFSGDFSINPKEIDGEKFAG